MENSIKKTSKKIPYIDYMCEIGERVFWLNLTNERFEGVIVAWLEDSRAVVKLDDGTIIEIQC
jgi:hypothetical protein